jgi:hypothetical protein
MAIVAIMMSVQRVVPSCISFATLTTTRRTAYNQLYTGNPGRFFLLAAYSQFEGQAWLQQVPPMPTYQTTKPLPNQTSRPTSQPTIQPMPQANQPTNQCLMHNLIHCAEIPKPHPRDTKSPNLMHNLIHCAEIPKPHPRDSKSPNALSCIPRACNK